MASAAPGSAAAAAATSAAAATAAADTSSPAEPCGCTNIAIMQLFHELKQQFPAVPDRVVSECISQNFHDKEACEAILRRENQGYLLHSYPSCLKMSSPASSEVDGSAFPRGSAAACPAASATTAKAPSEGPSCTAVAVPGQPALSHVYFVNQTSASSASSSSSSVFSQASKAREWIEFSDAQTSSVKRTESRWSSTHHSNSSTLESVASEVIKSTACGGGDVTAPRPGISSSSHTFVSQKEAASICRVGAEPAYASLPPPPVCARPTTLNVSSGVSGPTHTVSSPAGGATHFNPFQSAKQNPQHPASAGDRPPSAGDAGVPYTGSFRQRAHVFESNATSRGRGDPHQSASRENITTSVYSDHTVVNSYQVNVNCSVRGGGSSSVNVSGTSSRTVVTTPEATVTTVSPPRPAPPPRPPPPHPKPKPRQRSALTVDPAPHYAQQGAWGGVAGAGTVATPPPQQPRSYTSVNLTLRPPSSEPQAPIDIQSAGSSLMYSTSSYDPRQGYQSKLQICIGPGGVGSVSAMRTRAPEALAWGPAAIPTAVTAPAPSPAVAAPARGVPPPLPSRPPAVGTLLPALSSQPPPPASTESTLDSMASSTHSDDIHRELQALRIENLQGPTRALLERQLERKTRLQHELRREKEKLRAMQRDVRGMEKDLAQRQLAKRTSAYDALPHLSTLQKVQRLRQEIHLLTEECKKMAGEVDMSSDSRVPLGETDEEFYKNIYTGQQGSITAHANRDLPYNRGDASQQSARLPPPRPPPPEIDRESWTCTQCTFRNYWELEYCEQCEMPKLMLGTGPRPAPGAFCYCHPNPGKQLTPSVAAYPVYVPTPKLN